MRNKILMAVAAAFTVSSAGLAPYAANAYPSPGRMHKDGEIKNPAKADAAISKDMAKDAKKQAHKARKYAKVAAHKEKIAAKRADEAAKAPS